MVNKYEKYRTKISQNIIYYAIIQYSYMIIMRLFNIDINNTYTKFILMIPFLSITIFTIYFKIKPFNKKYQKYKEYWLLLESLYCILFQTVFYGILSN